MQLATSEAIRQTLEEEIASGQLVPGDRLEEVALAERFGVSRTPSVRHCACCPRLD